MGGSMFRRGMDRKRLWRPFIGVVVAYAVATQSLLIALGGFALPAQADERAPAFELCLRGGQGVPDLPAGNPGHSGCTHCIFCFAGAHHAVIESPPVLFRRVDTEVIDTPWLPDKRRLPNLPPYSIASPRGPPFGA
jgi:hypothetical protein